MVEIHTESLECLVTMAYQTCSEVGNLCEKKADRFTELKMVSK